MTIQTTQAILLTLCGIVIILIIFLLITQRKSLDNRKRIENLEKYWIYDSEIKDKLINLQNIYIQSSKMLEGMQNEKNIQIEKLKAQK